METTQKGHKSAFVFQFIDSGMTYPVPADGEWKLFPRTVRAFRQLRRARFANLLQSKLGNDRGRITPDQRIFRDVFHHHRAHAHDRAAADADAAPTKACAAIQTLSPTTIGRVRRSKVSLRQAWEPVQRNARWERQTCEPSVTGARLQHQHVLADPDVIAGGEPPREGDVRARAHHHAAAEARAEEPQQRRAQRRGPRERVEEKTRICRGPRGPP